jgi:hypothetical protein
MKRREVMCHALMCSTLLHCRHQRGSSQEKAAAWDTEGRDYHYSELLERVFDIMRAKNPAMVQGEKRRFVMKPPQVIM